MEKQIEYLAAPYSDPDPEVMEKRFQQINKVAAKLMAEGHIVFSPISHTHPIAIAGNLPKGFGYWVKFDTAFLEVCKMVWVLKLPGWKQSVGVNAERMMARQLGIPIEYIEWEGC